MNKSQLFKFISYLTARNKVYGPKKGQNNISEIIDPEDFDYSSKLTLYSFKKYLVPACETLFDYEHNKLIEKDSPEKQVLLGVSIFDLKAFNLYNRVFEKDPYYQARLKKTLIIGHSVIPEIPQKDVCNVFDMKYEEEILEHIQFDIFLTRRGNDFKVLAGSEDGQRLLDDFGYKDYDSVQFSGPIEEKCVDQLMHRLKDKMMNHYNSKIWEELGKRCIKCGKCTLVCPTCFCFQILDKPGFDKNKGKKIRCWDTCFYNDFSRVAGDNRFLDTTAKRIHFWYYHKFVRIPEEFGFMGCVQCGRCTRVCPVGIDLQRVLREILAS